VQDLLLSAKHLFIAAMVAENYVSHFARREHGFDPHCQPLPLSNPHFPPGWSAFSGSCTAAIHQ
jgi:hypothetical protein